MTLKFGKLKKILLLASLISPLAFAQDNKMTPLFEKGEGFVLPITFKGAWFFKNTENGSEFKGDMKIVLIEVIERKDGGISYSGLYSYDGRQTNSKCSTHGVFGGDKPVPLRFDHKEDNVFLTFKLPCPVGADAQSTQVPFSFDRQTLRRESNQPWGKGYQSLKLE